MTDAELDALVKRADQASESDATVYLIDLINSLSLALTAETARADRAEAERAAVVEVTSDLSEKFGNWMRATAGTYTESERLEEMQDAFSRAEAALASVIRAQPCDRTALEAAIRAAKVKAWKEAADLPKRTEKLGGQNYAYVRVEEILALIEREALE